MSLLGANFRLYPDFKNKSENLNETADNTCYCLLGYCFVLGSVINSLVGVISKSFRPSSEKSLLSFYSKSNGFTR